jgi:HPt (histidine-containing phosphotransfer) domain-containing protein
MNTITREIDREFLSNYYKEMVNEVGEIFQLFLEEMPGDLATLKNNLNNKNMNAVAEALHKIAPCFYNVGLPTLTKNAKELEASVRAGEITDIESRIYNFEEEYNEYLPSIIEESNRLNSL